jgi:hypothetical protein
MQTTSFLYRPVLKKAFEITSRFKNLWFFGLFAVLVSAGGEYEIISRGLYNPGSDSINNAFITSFQSGWQEGAGLAGGDFWHNLGLLILKNSATLATGLFVLLLIVTITLFVVWLVLASQIALIRNISLAVKNKQATIANGLQFANKNFWPIFVIIVCLKAALFVLFGILGLELMWLFGTGVWGAMLYLASFVVFVILTLIISFILKYQTFYVLLKRQKLLAALKSASELFSNNWLISLEMAGIMLGVYLAVASISVFVLSLLAGIPLIIIPLYLSALPALIADILAGIALVLAVAIILWLTAVMTVFQWAGWTVLFDRLEGGEEAAKLERLGQNLRQLPQYIFGK